jgi:hypothetical protein
VEQSPLACGQGLDNGRLRLGEEALIAGDALTVVDVQLPANRPTKDRFVLTRREGWGIGALAEIRPALAAVVDVIEVESGLEQELGKSEVGSLPTQRPEFVDLGRPSAGDCVAQAAQDDLRCYVVEAHVATGREERELELHGAFYVAT